MSARKPEWLTPEIVARFGKESDDSIARDVGRAGVNVRNQRLLLGIPAYGNTGRREARPAWFTPEVAARLGKDRDSKIAQDVGVDPTAVYRQRIREGVARAPQAHPKWLTPEIIGRLGKETDRSIAEDAGVAATGVLMQRRRLGIPPYDMSSWCTPEITVLLGTMQDKKVAAIANVSHLVVGEMRYKLGIPSCASRKRGSRPDWVTSEVVAMMGKISDAEIAKSTGRCTASVSRARSSLGIPSFRDTLPPGKTYLKTLRRRHRRTAAGLRAAFQTFENLRS